MIVVFGVTARLVAAIRPSLFRSRSPIPPEFDSHLTHHGLPRRAIIAQVRTREIQTKLPRSPEQASLDQCLGAIKDPAQRFQPQSLVMLQFKDDPFPRRQSHQSPSNVCTHFPPQYFSLRIAECSVVRELIEQIVFFAVDVHLSRACL